MGGLYFFAICDLCMNYIFKNGEILIFKIKYIILPFNKDRIICYNLNKILHIDKGMNMRKAHTYSTILSVIVALTITGCSSEEPNVQASTPKPTTSTKQKEDSASPKFEIPSFETESLLTVKKLAESGKAFNSGEFGIGASIETIKGKWGKPSAEDFNPTKDSTYTYNNKATEFKTVKGLVTTISYYASDLNQYSSMDIINQLGEPTQTQDSEASVILTYVTGKYKVIFICHNNGNDEYKLQAIDIKNK